MIETELHAVLADQAKRCDRDTVWYYLFDCCHHIIINVLVTNLHVVSADQAKHCDRDSIAMVTGTLVNDIQNLLSDVTHGQTNDQSAASQLPTEAKDALKKTNLNSIVLVSHSLGSMTAIDMMTGEWQQ